MAGRFLLSTLCVISSVFHSTEVVNGKFANQWAVYMHGGLETATQVAREHGFRNMGPVGMLKDVYLFTHRAVPRRHRRSALVRNLFLQNDKRVDLVVQQVIKKRVKREITLTFNDKRWPEQWILHNRDPRRAQHDMNILPAWKKGITGKNVVVTILDDGVEHTHRELRKNYDKNASYDYNGNDPDPMPRYASGPRSISRNRHGTKCAAQVAAEANNSFCIVGVAYNAKIGGIRMLDGDVTDTIEASSLTHRRDYIDIYSSSWGPDDNGITVDGPGNLTKRALEEGILYGRNGKGSIFVWASGNGGDKDDCNCDGYTNSIYTISAGAATSYGGKPWYQEQCASTLIASYGGGDRISDGRVVTADIFGGCTSRHTGTSVAAPFIAGFIALALEVNPNLTWRDVQHILVNSGNVKNLQQGTIKTNGANRKYSPIYGFGIVDGGALVDLAEKWSLVSEQHICKAPLAKPSLLIDSREKVVSDIQTKACKGTRNYVRYIEHTHVIVSLAHASRGAVSIYLISPMGTKSRILGRRKGDTKRGGFKSWAFLSTHFWGENPYGKWTLEIDSAHGEGLLEEWQLVVYGSEYMPGVPYQDADEQPFVPGLKGVRCHTECLKGCTGPGAHECVSCKNYKVADRNKTCVALCPARYFTDEISLSCLPCNNVCWSCIGPAQNQCISCRPGQYLYKNECIDKCPSDHYSLNHEVGFKCYECHGNCLTCSGLADNCTTCRREDMLVGQHCIPRCGHGYFFDGINCIPCHASCHTCNGLGNRNCTSCRYRGLHGNLDLDTMYFYKGSCLFTCPLNYYGDHMKGVCEPCGRDCLRCTSEGEQCTACKWGYYLPPMSRKDCVKECPKGQYPDLLSGLCRLCSKDCETCIPGRPYHCLACKNRPYDKPLYLKSSSCSTDESCGTGYFANKTSGMCQICPHPCSACKGDKNCENCNILISEDRCREECPSGTFRDFERRCRKCHPSCKECFGEHPSQCLECQRGMVFRSNRLCSWTCPPGAYYKDIQEQICKPCHPACTQCRGPSSHECQRCVGNLQLRGTTCVEPCVDNLTENSCSSCHPDCNSCFGATNTECLSCKHNKSLHEYYCRDNCPQGYYKQPGRLCMPCHGSCETCSGRSSSHCTSCPVGFSLYGGKCVLQCPKGYFKQDEWCLKCSEGCAECKYTEYICMHCKEGSVWRDLSCYDECGDGYFLVEGTRRCDKCHHSCKTCFGFNAHQCLSCPPGKILYDSTCFEDCPARYIAEAPTSLCNQCPENCITCFTERNLSVCEHCRYPFVMHNGKCIQSCPVFGYYSDFYSKRCKKCHPNCKMCYGPDKDECMLCKSGFSQIGSLCMEEKCGEGFFVDPKTLECQKCHKSCRSCSGPSSRDCVDCFGDYILVRNKCLLGCNDGTYPDTTSGQCRLCDQSCRTCNGSGRLNCTSCYEDHMVVRGQCHFLCKEGNYMDQNTGKCMPCNPKCKSCIGPKYNSCTDCNSGYVLLDGHCLKICAPGQFINFTSRDCETCHKRCKYCNGPTASNCTACDSDLVLLEGTCVNGCSQGQYFDENTANCEFCHLLCNDCYGPRPSNCLSCKNGLILEDGQCKLQCADSNYLERESFQCKRCHDNCKTCIGGMENQCTSCRDEFKLRDGKCFSNCPEGKYWDRNSKNCRICDALCKTCSGPSFTDCISCKDNYSLIEGKCLLFCSDGYYPEVSIGACLPCATSCRACLGPEKDECLICSPGFTLRNSKCLRDCKSDRFFNEVSGSCDKCVGSCATCFGPKVNECTSCKPTYNLIDNACYPVCKGSEYFDEKTWTCKACDSSCDSCFGPSRENCTLCKPGFVLIDSTCFMICEDGKYRDYASGQCLSCSEGCLACHGPAPLDCVACKQGFEFLEVTGCVEIKCPVGAFFDETSWMCKHCHPSCDTCSGESSRNCLSCREEYLLVNRSCLLKCQPGSFFNKSSGECHKCADQCLTCSGPSNNNCTSCEAELSLIGTSCKETCILGSYFNDDSTLCELCSGRCLTCDGPNIDDCTSCLPGYFIRNGSCITDCTDGNYFDASEGKCMPCSITCLSCNGGTEENCTGCFRSFALTNGKCLRLCNEGSYMNPHIKQCTPCDVSCKSCSGSYSDDCISCAFDKLLVDGVCKPRCADGLYFNRSTSQCSRCHPSCSQCSGPRDNECLQCSEHFLMIDSKCRLLCLEGTYPDRSKFECADCHPTCKDCIGSTRNNCTACFPTREFVNESCKLNCPKGFFVNEGTDSCEKCTLPCKECFGPDPGACTSCDESYRLSNNSCLPICSDGYLDEVGDCNICNSACYGCSDAGKLRCTYCNQNGILAEVTPCNCTKGYYLSSDGMHCENCHRECSECNGPGPENCITCTEGLYFDRALHTCTFICSVGTYVSGSECLKCDDSCQSCDGPTATDCLLCNDSLVLLNASCVKECPAGYYEFEIHDKSICVACDRSCAACSGGEASECTSCAGDLRRLHEGKCIANCASPYVLDSNGMKCVLPERKPPARKLLRSDAVEVIAQRLPYNYLLVITASLFIVVLFIIKKR